MTDGNNKHTIKKIEREKNVREAIEYHQQVSKLPLLARLNELRDLSEKKSSLEKELQRIDTKVTILEYMPDVAEERVSRDKISGILMTELQETGDIAYRNFAQRLKTEKKYNSPTLDAIVVNRLYLLKTAKLIEMSPDPSMPGDEIIKLTEAGKDFKYSVI